MKLFFISFTQAGAALSHEIAKKCKETHECYIYSTQTDSFDMVSISLQEFTSTAFDKADGIIYIGACGIAVRAIAPYLRHKGKDPGVVVLDEKGKFVISLLSGHMGGANALARELAGYTQGIPVITTATDIQGKTAVDVWAKKQGLWFNDWKTAKKISSAVLEDKKIGVYSDFPIITLPDEFCQKNEGDLGICISFSETNTPFAETLVLIPQIVSVGIGCKRDTDCKKIEKFLFQTLKNHSISQHSISCVCSIDLKRQEQGLIELCDKFGWDFCTFSVQELEEVSGVFASSPFVKGITGVDNVCERSAVLGSNGGRLIQEKITQDGITLAIAIKKWSVGLEV